MLSIIFASVYMEQADAGKFETIYYKYRSILFYNALSVVKNEADAEDVLQNAFIKIARNLKCVGDVSSKETAAFLIVITKNCAYDFLRKKRYEQDFYTEEAFGSLCDEYSPEQLISNIEYEKIVKAIKSIPSPYSEVMYLHYVNDYSVKKTAALLGRKAQTVKMQLVRGKKILVKFLLEVRYE